MSLIQTKIDYKNGIINKQEYINKMHNIHKTLFEYAEFITNTDIAHIEITDNSVVMTNRTNGIKLICDKDDKRIIPIEILNFDYYEKEVFDAMNYLIEDGYRILDIGGNIGWYAINISKAKSNVNILSFEPIPKTFAYLEKNLTLNNITNVHPYNFGFANHEEELTFYYYPEGSGNASLANLSERKDIKKIRCRVKKLDDFVATNNIKIDFIKCDVEGAELFVFQGGMQAIKINRPIIFTELLRKWAGKFNYHPNEVINLLKGLGYKCFVVKGKNLVEISTINEETVETNFFFLHTEKHDLKIRQLCLQTNVWA